MSISLGPRLPVPMTGPMWRRPQVAPVYAAVLAFAVVAGVSLIAPKAEEAPAPKPTPETTQAPPPGPTGRSRAPVAPTKEAPPPPIESPGGGATGGAESGSKTP